MKNLKERIKDKFDYDVSELPAYVDEQSQDILEDLTYGSGLTTRINVMEEVKGSKTIKLLNADLALQSVTGCSMSDDGTITFDGTDLVTKRVGVQQSLCNEDLTDTWAQMLLAIGANRQDREMPMEQVILAYLTKKSRFKNQNLMFNGDTTSGNPDLAHYDGFVKLLDNDADVVAVSGAALTNANAYSKAIEVYEAIPHVLFDNGVAIEIATGRQEARKIMNQVWADKDFNAKIEVTEEGSEMSFVLPNTNITVRTYPQLNGLGKMYALPYNYMFFGTDLESDIDGAVVKYLEDDEKLRMTNKWRSGVQYVYPEYFVRYDTV